MTTLIFVCVWAIAANLIAMLPFGRLHRALGGMLLLTTPYIIWLIYRDFGIWAVLGLVLVIISLFRVPLGILMRHLVRKITGTVQK